MNERIKKLRKYLDLTQREFAKRIGTTANVLTNYETGRRNPSSSVINNICKEFNINENWLRTGEGEMFNKEKRFSLDEFLQKQEATALEIEIVKLLFSFDKNTREELISKLKKLFQSETITSELSATITEPEIPLYCRESVDLSYEEIRQDAIDYFNERVSEKIQAEKSQALKQRKYESKEEKEMA